MELGRNLHQVQKAFNTLHAGFTRLDDHPPRRLSEPAKSGPFAGERLVPEKWEGMLDEYYRANLWDIDTGWQTAYSLRKTGLDEVADKLKAYGRLKT